MRKSKPHWYLTFPAFLTVKNSFNEKNKIILPFRAELKAVRDEMQIDTATIDGEIFLDQTTLEILMKDKSASFVEYVCKNKDIKGMSLGELQDAIVRYDHFQHLNSVFIHFAARIARDRNGTLPIDGFTYEIPSTDVFTVRKMKKAKETFEIIVSKESYKNDIFDNLNLTRLKTCEKCPDFFYASKDDGRIKFCSHKCANAAQQAKIQKKEKN